MAAPMIAPLLDTRFTLGEGPVWDEVEQALFFTDIPARTIHRYDWRSRELRSWKLPEQCGGLGLRRDGKGAVVAQRFTVELLDFATGKVSPLSVIAEEQARPHYRFNDAKVGPDGRFWLGSLDDRRGGIRKLAGVLYRIEADGSYQGMVEGIGLTNGLAWSPDGRIMYHADFTLKAVRAYDYDLDSGDIANERVFCQLDDTTGWPDGAAVDIEGYYWSAGFSAGRLNRIGPDGKIERQIDLPVRFPTMPCFCGPDLKTLAVTSLIHPMEQNPDAGKILAFRVDVPGTLGTRFRG
jgi:sugar lactone lactonase YvrE